MISYIQHKIKAERSQTVSKTVLLDSDQRRIVGVFAIMSNIHESDNLSIGLKYNGREVLPRTFPLSLITYKGLMPLRDAMLPTAYEVPQDDKNGVTISVEVLSSSQGGSIPDIDLYFVTER